MRLLNLVIVVIFGATSCALAESSHPNIGAKRGPVTKLLDLDFAPIDEQSGIVKSRTYDDVYWVHNDSGDVARLFALDGSGHVIIPAYDQATYYGGAPVAGKKPWPGITIEVASNIDWEDIAIDGDTLYIADMGNNGNARRDLGVYVVKEPNPRDTDHMRPLKFIPVRYPDQHEFPARQWHFDSESLFVFEGKLYFLTKHRKPGKPKGFENGTVLYRLDSMRTDEVNVLTRVEDDPDVFLATGADTSPDGKWLAVLCYTQLWLFPKPESGDLWLSGSPREIALDYRFTGQIEAITWRDDHTLLIGNEGSEWFTVDTNAIGAYPRPVGQSVK